MIVKLCDEQGRDIRPWLNKNGIGYQEAGEGMIQLMLPPGFELAIISEQDEPLAILNEESATLSVYVEPSRVYRAALGISLSGYFSRTYLPGEEPFDADYFG